MQNMSDETVKEKRCFDACPLGCQSGLRPSHISLPEGVLLRCMECGQLVSQCSEAYYVDSLRRWDSPEGTSPELKSHKRRIKNDRRRLLKIIEFLQEPAERIRLIDIGCSSGTFLLAARDEGFHVEGVELARRPAETAKSLGLKVHLGELMDAKLADASFDAITLFEIVEHLKDPIGLLKECFRILRKGGILMMSTGNTGSWTSSIVGGRWDYYSMRESGGHISFFNFYSIHILAQRTGFTVEKIYSKNMRLFEKGSVPPILYRLGKLISEPGGLLARHTGKGHDMLVILRHPGTR